MANQQELFDKKEEKKIDNVEEYKFEPIKGQPMLQWAGKRPFTSTQFFPAQKKETYGDSKNNWLNKIFWGDNLQVMSHLLKEFRGKVDLIYIDPPFDSKADYKKNVKLRGKQVTNSSNSFEEKQYTDIWTNDEYLQFMYERIILLKELLTDKGTIYLHCDHHKGHYIRTILDEVFSIENWHNTISWKRSHAQGNSGQGAKHFGRTTDVIHIYSNSKDCIWNSQFEPYTKEVVERDYKYEDELGRYRLMPVDGPGGASKGNPYYSFLGVTGYWRYSEKTMKELYDKGLIILSKTGKSLSRKKYLSDAKGTPLTDFWGDINRVSPTSNERLDYPTQKPLQLLERILKTSSKPGDLIFDCFMGSGTTQAVAMKLGRRFIGADINLGSVETTTKRLINIAEEINNKTPEIIFEDEEVKDFYTGFEVYNVNNYDIFRNPVEAKQILLEALEIHTPEGAALASVYDGEKDGYMVKIMPVNRIATSEDLNELISNLPYKEFEKRKTKDPKKPVESIMVVCMGHDPNLKGVLLKEVRERGYKIEVEVVDILRDKTNLEFKRDAEAEVVIKGDELIIEEFFPMNLLQKLSILKENVEDWREMVESIKIDFNYDGGVFEPTVLDIPDKGELVSGKYKIPEDASTVRVKITDVLSESLETEVENG
ncbi:site-specific DNA-methyltransferase [Flammeovirga sp. SJP92]|uniref:site-specific DNA-methyltransferase n=1 Tax=Flammeovirga sp. SJP92 TaxID=1775430 RepID=UPI0007899228|nr:site-specific DNA-methyltransferase [Flammeovirga sp. SJP92]KXX67410.1 DNA methylase [Flammeovirga sp. SJP92]